ncbi:MAG TPA: hypothetical protein VHA11_12000 [Bryobacteraceae bacterium]|nr:hypothetical protein [Bryobacteraceae bacterium]
MIPGIVLAAVPAFAAQAAPAAHEEQTRDTPGLPPRATPADYQFHGQAGTVTIAAEFTGHAVPTEDGSPLSSEEYVVVEVGLFGPPQAHTRISATDFSLRVNGKKNPLPAQPYGLVVKSVKDPAWEPPSSSTTKSKTSIGSGGEQGESKPEPVKIPIEVQRAMQQKIQKATLPEGDRALPQAGLIYFQYRGKTQGIRSLELIYSGPAGQATISLLQP